MKRVLPFICILLALVPVRIGFATDKAGPRLEDIRFEAGAPGEEQVIFRLNTIRIPKVFAIKGDNPRVVFDFPGTSVAGGLASTMDTRGSFIRRIRMGLHGPPHPKTRVVLDLVPGKNIDFRQKFDQAQTTLIVTLFRAGAVPGKTADKTPPSTPPAEKKPVVVAEKKVSGKKVVEKPKVQAPPAPSPPEQPRQPQPAARKKEPAVAAPASPVQPRSAQQAAAVPPPASVAKKPLPPRPAGSPAADNRSRENGSGKSSPPAPAAATGPVLRSITFDKSSNRGEMVLFKLSEFHPPVVFGIEEGVPRVVCDFKNTTAATGVSNRIKADGRYVRSIRVGRHRNPDKIRVVLDLEPDNNYDLQQVFFKDDNLFVIIINTINNAPTREEVEKPLTQKTGS